MDIFKKLIPSKRLRFKIISLFKFVPDKSMLKFQYKMKCHRKLNLNDPKRLTEKIQWYKLNYKDEKMPVCADKFAVREYIKNKGYVHMPDFGCQRVAGIGQTHARNAEGEHCAGASLAQKFTDFGGEERGDDSHNAGA